MTVYSYAEVREGLSALLERASTEGQVRFKNRDGRVFIIRPEQASREALKSSPFDVRSVRLPITRLDILEAIRESRARF
jgi:hypothetical protein